MRRAGRLAMTASSCRRQSRESVRRPLAGRGSPRPATGRRPAGRRQRVVPVGARPGIGGQPAASQCCRISLVNRGTSRGRSRHGAPQLGEHHVVVGGEPGPQLDGQRRARVRNAYSSSRIAAWTARPGRPVTAACPARAGAPTGWPGRDRTRWTPRRTRGRPGRSTPIEISSMVRPSSMNSQS